MLPANAAKSLFLALALLGSGNLSQAKHGEWQVAHPSRIILMRHAEKPDADSPNLSPAGYVRAKNLAALILKNYGKPDYIFASAPSQNSDRPAETIEPLAQQAGIVPDLSYANADCKLLAAQFFSKSKYAGKFIVIAWHHGKITKFARALKAPEGSYPEPWPQQLYSQFLQLDYGNNPVPAVKVVTEAF